MTLHKWVCASLYRLGLPSSHTFGSTLWPVQIWVSQDMESCLWLHHWRVRTLPLELGCKLTRLVGSFLARLDVEVPWERECLWFSGILLLLLFLVFSSVKWPWSRARRQVLWAVLPQLRLSPTEWPHTIASVSFRCTHGKSRGWSKTSDTQEVPAKPHIIKFGPS